ncbi:putative peptidyl-tRNA hydrolase [Penicillium longicatenatum]|nr:putative peptidyl-tRNA hydrolase [Penicillium longicatenatum]
MAAVAAAGPPRRLLFIASIGNQGPYRRTRHSAGHILLDELLPRLRARWTTPSDAQTTPIGAYYSTWYSPSFMNESGPKLVRQMVKSFGRQEEILAQGPALSPWLAGLVPSGSGSESGSGQPQYPATLVILHDELEAPLGKVRVKRGGPEAFSLRGHRGLISVCESLRGKGLYPAPSQGQSKRGKNASTPRNLSILRVGVGIGRPDSRAKNAVADYVLTEMDAKELAAVQRAVDPVMEVLEEELYRVEVQKS